MTTHNLKSNDSERALRERREIEAQEEEFARARVREKQRAKRDQYDAVAELRDELRQETANLRAELAAQHEVQVEACGLALGEMHEKAKDLIEARLKEIGDEFTSITRKLAELAGRLDALVPMEARGRSFRFANEEGDDTKGAVDLPNPLKPRRSLDS